jgi:hypothetical protein
MWEGLRRTILVAALAACALTAPPYAADLTV